MRRIYREESLGIRAEHQVAIEKWKWTDLAVAEGIIPRLVMNCRRRK
jgi:hypothetical protein